MTHDELAANLSRHLRSADRMVWCDMQLGPSGSVRPDVYAIFKSYARPCPTAYEVKVSVSDFRADVTAGKWQSYLKYATGVYFACEGNLITAKDVPDHCGLIVYRTAWRVAKKAVLSPVVVPQDALLKLLIDGVHREGAVRRTELYYEQERLMNAMHQKFGKLVGEALRDRLKFEHDTELNQKSATRIIDRANERAEEIRKEAITKLEPLRRELCEALRIPPDSDLWKIRAEVSRFKDAMEEHPATGKLRSLTRSVEHAIQLYGHKTESVELEEEMEVENRK